MNGEIAGICALTANVKYALKSGEAIRYAKDRYVNSESFLFLRRHGNHMVSSAEKWFKRAVKLGLEDVFMLLPNGRRELHSLSNGNTMCLLCFWRNCEPTYFVPRWSFNEKKRGWNAFYAEFVCENPPLNKPRFTDNTEEFKRLLSEITELADKLGKADGEKFWGNMFRLAKAMLEYGAPEAERLPPLPERNIRLYQAARKADVFGGMDSWNDSPPYFAEKLGLWDEYDRLSKELFAQIYKALLYAMNEF